MDPHYETAREGIERYIKDNQLLPNAVRHGLGLKSPDELVVFNEDRREIWDRALHQEELSHLDDLIMAFEQLANDDTYDAAAWYNLAVCYAWNGENAKAIEAMDHYVKIENDFEAAADAWDICELLRLGVGAEEYSDLIHYVASYEVADAKEFFDQFRQSKHVLVLEGSEEQGAQQSRSVHWMDKELQAESASVPLLGGPPRQLAQINLLPGGVELVATGTDNLRLAREQFEQAVGPTASPVGEYQRPGNLQTLDAEPLLMVHASGEQDQSERLQAAVGRYFEEDWIHRPLRSLGGLAPIDAAGSEELKCKIEGVVRFRERAFERFEVPYSFNRLRNKLGLRTIEVSDRRERHIGVLGGPTG